ncbi:MAG: hypothetical protein SGILL_000171 [Bacillariaceae sp.]
MVFRKNENSSNTRDRDEASAVSETEFKIHIARVPTKFDGDIVRRILEDKLQEDLESVDDPIIQSVELIYPREDNEEVHTDKQRDKEKTGDLPKNESRKDDAKEHRGFGFVSFSSEKAMTASLKLGTIKGGRKRTSTKLYTFHLRPYHDKEAVHTDDDDGAADDSNGHNTHDVCYLWSLNRCPYGDNCKFRHVGPGCCVNDANSGVDPKERLRKRKGKCFAFKKGKCNKGDDCPFSHDILPNKVPKLASEVTNEASPTNKPVPKSQKDCINWKAKGKCRKGDDCEYRHDPELQRKALEKKKRKRQDDGKSSEEVTKKRKEKQPLAVRVFGMPYDCTEDDVRDFFKDTGIIHKVVFPTFEDSGRSKGYCGVWFASPKAVAKALELDGEQLHDRWLRIQSGRSMDVREWEKLHPSAQVER